MRLTWCNRYLALTLAVFATQVAFSEWVHKRKPVLEIVPTPPSELTLQALAFGDPTFFFRVMAVNVQNMGDTGGRSTNIDKYDYTKLTRWFYLMDLLDFRSNHMPTLGAYIFGQSQKKENIRLIAKYLEEHSSRDPGLKWWWLGQAMYLANHELEDKQWALQIAYKLAKAPGNLPMWARQYPAFILNDVGKKEEAFHIIQGILQNQSHISQQEMNFMDYFLKEQLKLLDPSVNLESMRGVPQR
jgi:hypothetical protein